MPGADVLIALAGLVLSAFAIGLHFMTRTNPQWSFFVELIKTVRHHSVAAPPSRATSLSRSHVR